MNELLDIIELMFFNHQTDLLITNLGIFVASIRIGSMTILSSALVVRPNKKVVVNGYGSTAKSWKSVDAKTIMNLV